MIAATHPRHAAEGTGAAGGIPEVMSAFVLRSMLSAIRCTDSALAQLWLS
jgi:hypothetical protein